MILLAFAHSANARDWRVGTSIGFGGTGIAKPVRVNGTLVNIERSEGPGVFSVFGETLLSDKMNGGIEHSRGFRLGPFTSGLSFTGIYLRYYFFGPAPAMVKSAGAGESTILYRKYSLFLGGTSGVAQGKVSRSGDQVPNVSGTGVFMGIRMGADYMLSPKHGIRPELIYNTTFMASETNAPTLSEFAIQCGFVFSI